MRWVRSEPPRSSSGQDVGRAVGRGSPHRDLDGRDLGSGKTICVFQKDPSCSGRERPLGQERKQEIAQMHC